MIDVSCRVVAFVRVGMTRYRAECDACPWTSGTLPFKTADAARHMHELHCVMVHDPAWPPPPP